MMLLGKQIQITQCNLILHWDRGIFSTIKLFYLISDTTRAVRIFYALARSILIIGLHASYKMHEWIFYGFQMYKKSSRGKHFETRVAPSH